MIGRRQALKLIVSSLFLGGCEQLSGSSSREIEDVHVRSAASDDHSLNGRTNQVVSEADLDSLQQLLKNMLVNYDLPALAAAVIVKDKATDKAVVGVRKYGTDVLATIDDQFHLASGTKAMTATLIAMLIEEGKLSWTSTLGEIFPDVLEINDAFKKVTVEMLLAHRAGFRDDRHWPRDEILNRRLSWLELRHFSGSPRQQRLQFLSRMLEVDPDYEPGTFFAYSNTGYAILGAISEKLTDTQWETLITKRLFDPLGMKTAGFGAMGREGAWDQPLQHIVVNGKVVSSDLLNSSSDNPTSWAPGAAVHCSIGDWSKFVKIHVDEGRSPNSLLKRATFLRLHSPPFGGNYMAGWYCDKRSWADGIALHHTGTNTQNFADVWLVPRLNFAVMVATNEGGKIASRACDAVCSAVVNRNFKDR